MHSSSEQQQWQKIVSDFLSTHPEKPLIVIIGPTASGKTSLSLDVAEWIKKRGSLPEIINADSRQFYRGLDIGTAKICQDDTRGIPHHLLSVLQPDEDCSIAWFQKEVLKTMSTLHSSGSMPILVGGSMLYVSAIVDGLQPMASDPSFRQRLTAEYDTDNGTSLYTRLSLVDPATAATIPQENKAYVVRAMEIIESTGKTKSEALSKQACPYDLLLLGIAIDRPQLRERLLVRTKAMFDAGWIDEVRALLAQGYDETSPAMQSHGYREILHALRNGLDTASLQEIIVTKGMQYAKRHQTWWKGDERVRWIQATSS